MKLTPNIRWLAATQGETVLLQFPDDEYVVTVHNNEDAQRLIAGGSVIVTDADSQSQVSNNDSPASGTDEGDATETETAPQSTQSD